VKSQKLQRGMTTPRVMDAYTGEDIKYTKAGDFWIASTSLWTSRPFNFLDDLKYALSYSMGVPPRYNKPGIEVTRNEGERPKGAEEE